MIPLKDLWKIKEDVVIHQRGKTRIIIAGFDLTQSGRGYTTFSSDTGSYSFRDDGYGTAWWCQPVVRISKSEWDEIPNNYKGRWDEWIKTKGFQPDLPDEYIGKRAVFEGCITDHGGTALLTEGIHFIIED